MRGFRRLVGAMSGVAAALAGTPSLGDPFGFDSFEAIRSPTTSLTRKIAGAVPGMGPDAARFHPGFTPGIRGDVVCPAGPSAACLLKTNGQAPNAVLLQHAANVGILSGFVGYNQPVMRDDIGVVYADTRASCANPDGFAQIQPAAGHCWTPVFGANAAPTIWGAAAGTDISGALQKSLAYLGTLGGSQRLDMSAISSSTASAMQITIPTNVSVDCGKSYEGGDGSPEPTINFTNAAGGFYMADKSSIHGCNLSSNIADHLLEIGGQAGIDHVRIATVNNGVLTTHNVTPNVGALDQIGKTSYSTVGNGSGVKGSSVNANGSKANRASNLTNGTYHNVPFTGGGGNGATITVTIAGNVITSGSFDGAGTGYTPCFQMSLARNAIYPGSPQLSNIATGLTVNGGRTHISYTFVSSTGKGIGIEMPPGYDFEDADHNEVWNSTGSIVADSVGFEFYKTDGLNAVTFKCFGYNTCFLGNGPITMTPTFQTFTDLHCDFALGCLQIQHPLQNLVIVGGYYRAIGVAIFITHKAMNFSISGTSEVCQANSCIYLQSSNSGTITGNNFSRSGTNSAPYVQMGPSVSDGSLQSVYFGGNSFDLYGPGVYMNVNTRNITIGPNAWPYGSAYAYVSGPGNATDTILPTHGGRVSLVAGPSGSTIAHGLGYAPQQPSVRIVGSGAATTDAVISGTDATNITVTFVNRRTGAVVTTGTFSVAWSG